MTPTPETGGFGPAAAARRSLSVFGARPVSSLALGAAIVVSLSSVCCGLGLLTTPWFLCELFALQLSQLRGTAPVRSPAWVGAALVQLVGVLLVALVASLGLLGGAPEPSLPPEAAVTDTAALWQGGATYAAGCAFLMLALVLPFLFAPLFILEGRTGVFRGLVASALAVQRGGHGAHLSISFVAHVWQAAPALAVALWLHYHPDADHLVPAVLACAAAMAVTVPLGQGMITAAYTVCAPSERALRRIPATPRRLSLAWTLPLSAPPVALVCIGLSLFRPSPLVAGPAPAGEPVATCAPAAGAVRVRPIRDTALSLRCAPDRVVVEASDGGGVGVLPLPSLGSVREVRVARVRDTYVVAVEAAGGRVHTRVDGAGVRLDDGLRRRLLSRLGPLELLACLLAMGLTVLVASPGIAALSVSGEHTRVDAARTRSLRLAILLAPVALWLLYLGGRVLLA